MHTLFSKIFLWFWTTMAVVASLVALAVATQTEPIVPIFRGLVSDALDEYARAAASAFQQGGQQSLNNYLSQLKERVGVQALLFDRHGHELDSITIHSRWMRRNIVALAGSASVSSRPVSMLSGRYFLWGCHSAPGKPGDRILIASMPRPVLNSLGRNRRDRVLRVILLVLITGVLCYGLARSLSAPIVRLSAAVRRLGAGDLRARVGPVAARGGDELALLAQDFDRMAGRIESLVISQRRVLGDISHELRSPLARLQVALELARRTAGDPTARFLERIGREAGRLDELIGQLLALARLDSAEPAEETREVNLTALIRDVVDDADFEARSRRREVQVTESRPAFCTGAEALLRSAVENVVRNAVRYTAEDTTVDVALSVEAGESGSTAVVRVRDYGPGVSEQALPDLFQPFYRAESSRNRDTGGVGLGLAITRRVAERYGGSATAANAPDGGLLVELRLPCTIASNPDAPSPPQPLMSPIPGSGERSRCGYPTN